jgi:hypothetical protein
MDFQYNNLDDEWINNFEQTDKLYSDFYKDDLYYITLRVLYINRENEIDKLKQESLLISKPNVISREEILGILKKNSIDNDKRYTLISILKYNITLDVDEIKNYLQSNETLSYLSVIKNIDTVVFEKSISMFHDLNDLILVFYEKSNELKKKNINNSTKKIYLNASNKKTIKKRFKD